MAKVKGSATSPTPPEDIQRMRALMVQPGSEEFAAQQRERRKQSPIPTDQRRFFRNMQRSVGRDITMTDKAMQSATGREREYLEYRLSALQELRQTMLSSYKDEQGYRHYNTATGRIEAMQQYIANFKGKAAMNEQRTSMRRLTLSEGSGKMLANVSKLMGYSDESENAFDDTPLGRELLEDLDRAIRQYDSGAAKVIMAKIMHGREAFESSERQNYS